MVKIYARKILESDGEFTLEDVPERWRDAVREYIESLD